MARRYIRIVVHGDNRFLVKGIKDVINQAFLDSDTFVIYEDTLVARYASDLIIFIIPSNADIDLTVSRFNDLVISKTVFLEHGTKQLVKYNEKIGSYLTICDGSVSDFVSKIDAVIDRSRSSKRRFSLSKKELSILLLLSRGYSSEHVGRILDITCKTVSTHKRKAMHKLDIKNNVEMNLWLLDEMSKFDIFLE